MRQEKPVGEASVLEVERLTDLPRESLEEVARAAGGDAELDPELLGSYLPGVLRAARAGRSVERTELAASRRVGERAAERGVSLPRILDLYLSAAWRLWREIEGRAGSASAAALSAVADSLFRSSDDTAQAIGEGFQEAQRLAIRREEGLRREFVDDLLSGTSDLEVLQQRAEGFGFNLLAAHRALVAVAEHPLEEGGTIFARAEARILREIGADDVLVATKEGRLILAVPAAREDPASALLSILSELDAGEWRIGVGGVESGVTGVSHSYRQALEAVEIARKLRLPGSVADHDSLVPYHLLLRDRAALQEMVERFLGGLRRARGGAEPLLQTLEAYFAEGGNVSATARRLHLTPRAVTYRLKTISDLTGRRAQDPEDRFLLQLTVRGARLAED